jgi:hypothetical protein
MLGSGQRSLRVRRFPTQFFFDVTGDRLDE